MTPSPVLDFQQAKANHLLFQSRLRSILYADGDASDSRVLSQYACSVGKWLYGYALIYYEAIPEVYVLEEVHSQLHRIARDLISHHQAGSVAEARQGLSTVEELADQLVELLQTVEAKVKQAEPTAHSALRSSEPTDSAQALRNLLAQNELLDSRIKQHTGQGDQLSEQTADKQQGLYNFFMQAPAAFCILRGPEHVFELANPIYQTLIGGRNPLKQPIRQALPELAGQGFYELLDNVYATQQPFVGRSVPITFLDADSKPRLVYLDFIYQPSVDRQGKTDGILVFAYDVTEQVVTSQAIEASEAKLRSVIATAPAAMGLFLGRDLVIDLPNQAFIDIVGKGPDIVGKPLREVMPELASQPFLQILDDVYTSGKMFQSYDTQVDIVQHGVMTHNFYNITYTPLLDEAGQVYGILDIAIDVTSEVKARQQVMEAEASLRGAIELAELGTWTIDLPPVSLDYSPRLRDWLGIGQQEVITVDRAYRSILEADRERVKAAMLSAIAPHSHGTYDIEYSTDAQDAGQQRILHAQGQAYFTDDGIAYKVSGTVQDVTLQRNTQLALEQQVQQRTEELEAANARLEDVNRNLTRSNQNLEQFAYVASHDLQEPLRKIQSFGDLLKTRYVGTTNDELIYLDRMQSAASRMSLLIKDLLAFSRISTRHAIQDTVALGSTVERAMENLSVAIEESQASINIGVLPTVQGDGSQLEQLFQNLLANAIKFSRRDKTGRTPQIQVVGYLLLASELPPSVIPTRQAEFYHQLEVIDNGIGFDDKYTDRIFQVFQRLHGKNEFAGTGIGLAICQKVVDNHGGAITASSKPGQGATFTIYLPQ
ncbi:ATP-binding protein [Spirosoma agri]|uniref:histidine kinase n=1 Tax=Spirosoma agri TaxID=1987381 RepID=A0A6M0IHR5_9BACT|nr:ATP-binding protein [Spirosoma agri]NEU67809.1 PAS domain-containing protein [Spirosoma agri]